MSRFPFEVSQQELHDSLDEFVDITFASLSSYFLELPRGENFLEYDQFRDAYHRLSESTSEFKNLDYDTVVDCIEQYPRAFTVLRCIVGVSPPDLADMATELSGDNVTQGAARVIDQKSRKGERLFTAKKDSIQNKYVSAIIHAACRAIQKYSGTEVNPLLIHRLEKIDTYQGVKSLNECARNGVHYSVLLYERMLGRPFASHRDGVSELVGELVESAIVKVLTDANVPFHKTKRAEVIEGFDQAPDFLIPNKSEPKVVIEAKLTQDDGTARDKVTRVQHLHSLSKQGAKYEVIACIDGRGFRIRREDMRKLLRATNGKVFSVATIDRMIEMTGLKRYINIM